jgi:hypothetical protein
VLGVVGGRGHALNGTDIRPFGHGSFRGRMD